MKYINTIKTLFTALAAATLFACNEVDSDERFIQLPAVEAQRVVLLEEYTGQKCVNCPEAHDRVKALLNQYGENLISVSIHCGGSAFAISSSDAPFGLATDLTQSLGDAAGVYSLPCGVVNRSTEAIPPESWANEIRKALEQPSCISLAASASIEDGSINVAVDMEPHDNFDANLVVWVVESGIVALQQKMGNQFDMNYVHDHVLRESANGRDGDAFHFVTRQPQTANYSIKLQENWNSANLSVVVFVYNKKGVLQAAQAHLANV